MAFRDNLRKAVGAVRAIPGVYGVRPYTVQVEVKSWSGAERGEGVAVTDTTTIAENGVPPKVRWLRDEELAVGGYASGAVEVGPITPDYPGGGTALSTLVPTLPANSTLRYILTGPRYPDGAHFVMKQVRHDRGYQYSVVLEPA